MFKGFSNGAEFNGFPTGTFGMDISPYAFAGAEYWLDASSLVGLANLAAVSRWSDRIRGVAFEQSVAGNQPRFVAANVNYNGMPTVEAVDTVRNLTSLSGFLFPTFYTLVLVGNYNTLNTINLTLNNTGIDFGFGFGGSFAGINGAFMRNETLIGTGTTESNSPKIAIITSNNGIMVNGVLESTSVFGRFQYIINRLFRGTASNTSTNGNLAEVLLFNRSFTEPEMLLLSTILNQKYALY